ncbi:ribonuclease T2 [Aureimonas sp. AU20]|uniref:ribonuclease T2 family protein n=1 Tax=Aureimonas sp. AU20 TaxID=1349819 RepID=UPI00071F0472|nr:ribonuclease T2 [Aureimonas sp. AU20]ALN72940.1 hypothetical protein M673_09440 [Aureimonas sp. AU20]
MGRYDWSLAAGFALVLTGSQAFAQVPMSGQFVAEASCFATPSIRSDANPGRIVTEPGRSYDLLGRNAMPGSHYLIRVPGADPERRWVAYGCGRVNDGSSSAERVVPGEPAGSAGSKSDSYILAASWHPSFCETRPRRADCRGGGEAAHGFSLHGLWPQPRGREYCGVSPDLRAADEAGRWRDLPAVEISAETRRALERVMPGTVSQLERHEYWTHGTCFSGSAEAYFVESIRLIDELSASPVGDLFGKAIGREVSAAEIRAAFDAAFGDGAGKRVLLDCESDAAGRRLVGELRISLRGALGEGPSLPELIRAGDPVSSGCRAGRVDAPGFG